MSFDELPKMHLREAVVEAAEREFGFAVARVWHGRGITHYERIGILARAIQAEIKYALRFERHGNYDTPSGVEGEK